LKETVFSRIFQGSTPFCIDLEKKDSYIIDLDLKPKNKNDK